MQNIFSNLVPGSAQSQPDDGVPWWMKYLAKIVGILAGGAGIFFGIWCVVLSVLSPMCIVGGILLTLAGFIVIVTEAPFCCFFLDFVQKYSGMVEGRPVWQKAAFYLILSIIPVTLCQGFTILLGCGAIFGTSVLYGMQVLGKKATREEMRENATAPTASGFTTDSQKSTLVGNIYGQDVEVAKESM